jgi:hypothetical protein
MMFSGQFAKLGIPIYQLFFQAIRGCDVHIRAFLLSDDGSGQDGDRRLSRLETSIGLSRTAKMVAQQVSQSKRVNHSVVRPKTVPAKALSTQS